MKWLIVIGAALGAFVWWNIATSETQARYRLTLTVETPLGERSGSSVIEVLMPTGSGRGLLPHVTINPRVRGEAVFVELGAGKNIVMLLAHGPRGEGVDAMASLPMRAMGATWDTQHKLTGSVSLTGDLIPTLVTFSDLTDPASARVVAPTDAGFAAAFGPGFRLARVTLEMVPAGVWPFNRVGLSGTPVTTGIEGKVAFLKRMRDDGLSGRIDTDPNRFIPNFPYFVRG